MFTAAQRNAVRRMCPVASSINMVNLLDRACGSVTISSTDGTAQIAVPTEWGTSYVVAGLVLRSGPASIVTVRAVQKAEGAVTIQVVDSAGDGVDCSTTNAVVDYLIVPA